MRHHHHHQISKALIAILGLLLSIQGVQAQLLVSSNGNGNINSYNPTTGAALTGGFATGVTGVSKVVFGPDGYIYAVTSTATTPPVASISRFLSTGVLDTTYKAPAALPTSISSIAFGLDGKLYVVDSAGGQVLRYTAAGTLDKTFVTGLQKPSDLTFDTAGNLYVAEVNAIDVKVYDPTGALKTTVALRNTTLGPVAIALDSNGLLYVSLPSVPRVLRYTVSTGFVDPTYILSNVGSPFGIGLDLSNNVYVVDSTGNRVVKFTQTSIAGSTFVTAGTGTGALSGPLFATWAASLTSVTAVSGSLVNGVNATGTVTLNYNAPFNLTVALTSSNPAFMVPATVTVAAGTNSITFPITTAQVSASTTGVITASVGGVSQTANIAIIPDYIKSISLSASSVASGASATGTVKLSQAAGPNPIMVKLTSSNPALTVPATVTVPAGGTSVTFPVTTSGVSTNTVATVSASTYDQTTPLTANLTIKGVTISSFSIPSLPVVGTDSATANVNLAVAAIDADVTIALSSSNTAVATVASTITIKKNTRTGTFAITTFPVTALAKAKISASVNGATQTGTMSVRPIYLQSVSVSPSAVASGTGATGTVTLERAALVDTTVNLSNGGVSQIGMPATTTITAGTKTATFGLTTNTVTTNTVATVSASVYDQSASSTPKTPTTTFTVKAVKVASLSGFGSQVGPLTSLPVSVNMSQAVPYPITVAVVSNNPNVLLHIAKADTPVSSLTVTIPAGSSIGAFYADYAVVTTLVNGTVAATYNGGTVSTAANAWLNGPRSISLSTGTAFQVQKVTGSVTLYHPAASDTTVTVNIAPIKTATGTIPAPATLDTATVIVPAGKTVSGPFHITTQTVTVDTRIVVNARILNSAGAQIPGTPLGTTSMLLKGPGVATFTLAKRSIQGGASTIGTITLNTAFTMDQTIALDSNDPSTAFTDGNGNTITSIVIPAGTTKATVTVQTTTVTTAVSVHLTATLSPELPVLVALTVTP